MAVRTVVVPVRVAILAVVVKIVEKKLIVCAEIEDIAKQAILSKIIIIIIIIARIIVR